MSFKATDILNKYLNYLESGKVQQHAFQAVNETKAVLEDRIFNSEVGAKDTKGKSLGGYSVNYAMYRKSYGYNSTKKDLEFTGDLRRSIKVEKTDLGARIFMDDSSSISKYKRVNKSKKPQKTTTITNKAKAKYIEAYQTKKGNTAIFAISKKEIEYCKKKYKELINKDLIKLVGK